MKILLEKIFTEINKIIKLDEIAYLEIQEGILVPIYKRDTQFLSNNEWKEFHTKYISRVKDNPFLVNLVKNKQVAIISDTNGMKKKPDEFEALNIRSIYLFPVIKDDQVKGIVDIAFVGNKISLTESQIDQITTIVNGLGDKLYENC